MTTIVNAALEALPKIGAGLPVDPFEYMAIGTGTTAEQETDTGLESEITTGGGERSQATCSYESGNLAVFTHEFTFTAELTITEVGIFNALSGGTMLLRHVYTEAKVVKPGESLQITIKVNYDRPEGAT